MLASFVDHTLMLRHGDGQRVALRGEIFVSGDRRPLWQDSSLRGAAKHTIALALSDGPSGAPRWSAPLSIDTLGDTLLTLPADDGAAVCVRAEVRPAPGRMAHRLVLLYEVPSGESGESGDAGDAGDAAAIVAERAASFKSVELRVRLNGLEVSLFDGSATALASSPTAAAVPTSAYTMRWSGVAIASAPAAPPTLKRVAPGSAL